jgi:hypothetical protein
VSGPEPNRRTGSIILHPRIQTPGPSTEGFKAIFEKNGGVLWKEWDDYLGNTLGGWNKAMFMARQ